MAINQVVSAEIVLLYNWYKYYYMLLDLTQLNKLYKIENTAGLYDSCSARQAAVDSRRIHSSLIHCYNLRLEVLRKAFLSTGEEPCL